MMSYTTHFAANSNINVVVTYAYTLQSPNSKSPCMCRRPLVTCLCQNMSTAYLVCESSLNVHFNNNSNGE